MSALGSGENGWLGGHRVICGRRCCPGQGNGLGAQQSDPTPSELTPWPILPQHWKRRDGFRCLWGSFRQRGNGCGGTRWKRGEWPENGADPTWFRAVTAFLTRRPRGAGSAIPDASCIQHPVRAITLRSAFLWIQRMMSRTQERPIRLRRKGRSWKAAGKRCACPLRRAIHHRFGRLNCGGRRDYRCWFGNVRRGKFRNAHGGGSELLAEFQAKIPQPLANDLPEFLPTGGTGTPPIGLLLHVFISQHGFK